MVAIVFGHYLQQKKFHQKQKFNFSLFFIHVHSLAFDIRRSEVFAIKHKKKLLRKYYLICINRE
jgi:hypothetical protein